MTNFNSTYNWSYQPKEKKEYYGLNNLDEKLEKYLNYDGGFFVELGANDGKNQSNTLYYEKFRGWTGVLVEPVLHSFINCKLNRSSQTKVYCNACTSFDYSEKFVEIIYSNLMSTATGLESDLMDPKANAIEGKQYLHQVEENITFGALAKPLNEILKHANAPSLIDFFSLDVEGAEIEVLKGIDHDHFRFRFICIECRNVEKMKVFLDQFGYELIEKITHHDYVFKSKII